MNQIFSVRKMWQSESFSVLTSILHNLKQHRDMLLPWRVQRISTSHVPKHHKPQNAPQHPIANWKLLVQNPDVTNCKCQWSYLTRGNLVSSISNLPRPKTTFSDGNNLFTLNQKLYRRQLIIWYSSKILILHPARKPTYFSIFFPGVSAQSLLYSWALAHD